MGRVAPRTSQIDQERATVLERIKGDVPVRKIDAKGIRDYQANARPKACPGER